MKRLFSPFLVLMTALAMTSFSYSATANNLIQNGSFEDSLITPPIPPGFTTISSGSTDITNWLVTSDNIDYVNIGSENGSDGFASVDLNGTNPGSIAQSFNTIISDSYLVTFDLIGSGGGGSLPIKTVRVAAAGQFADYTYNTAIETDWSSLSFEFTAISTSTTLEFISLSTEPANTFRGPVIDNVIVTSPSVNETVLEPSAILSLLTIGGIALGASKKKQS